MEDEDNRLGRGRPHAETRLLYRITKALNDADLSLEDALHRAIDHLSHYGYARSAIALRDARTGEVRLEVSRDLSQAERKRGRFQPGEGIIGRVIATGEAAIVPSIDADPRFLDRTRARKHLDGQKLAFICVPIPTSRREMVGTLSVDVPHGTSDDLNWDRRLLSVVATLIGESVRRWRDEREEAQARDADARHELPPLPPLTRQLIGNSRAIREVADQIRQVAAADLTVLIRGESGTGKEIVARAIHAASVRSAGPFVSVNCGALPEHLVESELFGHVRGAFTGAVTSRAGRFEKAQGGTLFLDEIGDLAPALQVRLLRVLQEGEIYRVGEDEPRQVDVRVIAATHRDLESLMRAGRFREDLFYRLNVFPIYVPPLRERKSDITVLADHFVERHAAALGKPVIRISTPAIDLMCAYHWPGNVRELENCIERAVLLARDGVVRDHHLPPSLQTGASSGTTRTGSLEAMMMAHEREILIEAMKDAKGNMSGAARALETTPRILAYRLKKHGLYEDLALRRRE
ncbi:MAG: sigma 54-interacting transcriptional regulator [bacterium]